MARTDSIEHRFLFSGAYAIGGSLLPTPSRSIQPADSSTCAVYIDRLRRCLFRFNNGCMLRIRIRAHTQLERELQDPGAAPGNLVLCAGICPRPSIYPRDHQTVAPQPGTQPTAEEDNV